MWIVRLALRRPYTVLVSVLLVFLFGVLSLQRLKRDILPNIDIPVVILIWNYPGLSAQDMERRVTFITERALSTTVNGISRIESQSLSGIGLVRVYFEPGSDIGAAIAQVAAVSATITRILPPGITPPAVLQYNASNVQVAQLTLKSQNVTEQALFDYALNFLRLRLFTIPGLATPAPYGGKNRQVMVDIDPAKAKARGVSPQDVVNALQASNVILPAGNVRIGNTEYDVLLNSSPAHIAEFNDMPLKVVNGVTVRLGDVVFVHDGFAVQNNVVRVNGRRATYLSILRKAGASTLAVVDSVRSLLPALQAAAPPGVQLSLDFDQSLFVRGAIKSVLQEAVVAACLVSFMIFFFLGNWRSMVLVSTSIPVAILAGVVGLFLTGQTLNLMTLGGLALAVGMLVDDATVEVENIHRNRMMDKPLTVAILDGAHQVAVPALAATLTICIVFFPVVMLEGPARFLFTPLALAVVFSMLASYLLSRTLVPSLARRLLRHEPVAHPAPPAGSTSGEPAQHRPGRIARFNVWRDRNFDRMREAYGGLLAVAIAHSRKFMVGVLLFAVMGLALLTVVGLDFFPSVDTGQMRLHVRAPPGQRIEQTEVDVAQVEAAIRRIIPAEELDTINDNHRAAHLVQPGVRLLRQRRRLGRRDLDPAEGRAPPERPLQDPDAGGAAQAVPPAAALLRPRRRDHPGAELRGPGDDRPAGRGPGRRGVVRGGPPPAGSGAPGAGHRGRAHRPGVEPSRPAGGRQSPAGGAAQPDRAGRGQQLAHVVDLVVADGAQLLDRSQDRRQLLGGGADPHHPHHQRERFAGDAADPGISHVHRHRRRRLARARDGHWARCCHPPRPRAPPPPTLLTWEAWPCCAPPAIGRPSVTTRCSRSSTCRPRCTAGISAASPGSSAGDGRDQAAPGDHLDPAWSVREHDQLVQEPGTGDAGGGGPGLSVADGAVPVGAGPADRDGGCAGGVRGHLWMLVVTGTTLNVESFMGSIMAIGIAVSNSILLVSFANQARAEQEDMTPSQAALTAGKTRLRPVLMTALAMILGMLPMALGLGEGGEQNAPLGRAVIGGLLMATLVTLFVVPTVYTLLRRKPPVAHALDQRFLQESTPPAPPAPGAAPA
jgi:multidrug efflux pump subunit AcrB